MNPLYNLLGGSNAPGPMGNMAQMIQRFHEFKANFQGDPKQEVERLLQSGRISQDQLNQIQQMAQMLQQYLK